MNRIQFIVLVVLASLVFIFLLAQAAFALQSQKLQVRLLNDQQAVQQGRVCDQRWRQLIGRVAELSQKYQDQGLKDILSAQGVTIKPAPPADGTAAPGTAPAPSTSPAPAANP